MLFAPLVDGSWLDQHASFFVVVMNDNCITIMLPFFDQNPTSWLGQKLGSSGILQNPLSKYLNLIEISIVIILGFVEGEQTFSTLSYMKTKLKNYLTNHLELGI